MPKRSRSGVVSSPARVVAPMRVNGGRSMVTTRAPAPWPTVIGRRGAPLVVEKLLAGESVLAIFPTGAGKSLCYQLPALLLDGITLVVSPLIALMKDQIDALHALGIDAPRLDSSLPFEEAKAVERRLLSGELRLLYVSPERFNNERFLQLLSRIH